MNFLFVSLVLLFFQGDPPYKPKDDFEIKLVFEFKQRPSNDTYKVNLDESRRDYERRTQAGLLPYLFLNVNVLKIDPEEVRVKVVNNLSATIHNKKLEKTASLKLELGFTDDIKDHVSAYHYTIFFLSQNKTPLSKIDIHFEEDGSYLVNGEKRGKI